ncbi:MAG TPA: glycine cleavage system protein GcvH [Bacillota bacterium]|nr:glycine cleavage system protein GcvH [Bacillota bacterium]
MSTSSAVNLPKDYKYTSDHLWISVEGDLVKVGITDYGQAKLGDIVFIELPSAGERIAANEVLTTIESVKNGSDIQSRFRSPIDGEIMETNDTLEHSPELVNQDPFKKGWLVIIEPSDSKELKELLTGNAYASMIKDSK